MHHAQTLWADTIHRTAVVESSDFKDGDLIIDVGTGTALTSIFAMNKTYPTIRIRVIGVDLSSKMLLRAKRNLTKFNMTNLIFNINCDARFLPLRGSIFDKIISLYGLGGIRNIKKAFRDLILVAKDNAVFSLGEMTPPPKEKSVFRRKVHEILVEPFIRIIWQFQDLNLEDLLVQFNLEILKKEYFGSRYLGSITLVVGRLKKR